MRCRSLFVLVAMGLSALPLESARAALFKVGGDAGCTHSDIEAALQAAEANAGPDDVLITRSATWYDQDITATATANLHISGGYGNCLTNFFDFQRTELRGDTSGGATGDQEPVLRLDVASGVVVTLSYLTITKGDQDGDGRGGGIYYRGNASTLRIYDSLISSNIAGYGGGIYVELDQFTPTLLIGANTTIASNTARYDGGGINMGEYTRLVMKEAGSIIAFNKALGQPAGIGATAKGFVMVGGFGGGIRVFGGSSADIASSGVGSLGAIYGNEARYGGGVSIANDVNHSLSTLRVYTTDPQQPTAIRSNFASVAGGGVHASPYKSIGNPADETHVRLHDANIQDNIAPQGAAIHLTSDTDSGGTTTGADLYVNVDARPQGGVACATGVRCSVFSGNDSFDSESNPTTGATIYAGDDASAQLNRTIIEDNTGGDVVRGNSAGDGIGIVINDSLIANNVVTRNVLHTDGDSPLALVRSTIAGNSVGGNHVLDLDDAIKLQSAIVYQPGTTVLAPGGGTRDILDVLADEIGSLQPGLHLYQGNPRFVDPERRDYRLRAASPAVDYSQLGGTLDLDGLGRGLDLALVPNANGSFDLGAYERRTIGNLVQNPNFNGDFHQWSAPIPPAIIYSTDNADGNGTGSLRISYADVIQSPVIVLSQCVHVPGPGTYELNASGRATAAPPDQFLLKWEVRSVGTEACGVGSPDAGGDFFVSSSSTWTRPSSAGVIQVTPAQWTRSTSVVVSLAVSDSGTLGEVQGNFDGVVLEPGGQSQQSPLLVDGFEGP